MTPGLINSSPVPEPTSDAGEPAPDPSAAGDVAKIQDPLLKQAEMKVEEALVPMNRVNYRKIVIAGMQLAMNGDKASMLYKLKDSKDPVKDCAMGAIGLVLMMRKQSQGTMPLKAMVPAAMTLMLKALDFAEQARLLKVDNSTIVKASHIFTSTLFRAFKISPQMLQNAAKNVHGMTENPVHMSAMERTAGMKGVGDNVQPAQTGG